MATLKLLIDGFKKAIAKQVEISDLGELHWILGIEVRRERENKGILFSQRAYLDSILRHYGLLQISHVIRTIFVIIVIRLFLLSFVDNRYADIILV